MKEVEGQIFDALVHGFYIALGIGAVAAIIAWSFTAGLLTAIAAFVLTGVAPAIYQMGRGSKT